MSLRTHIPWINFSGSSSKVKYDGCGNFSSSYSAFSGLGTRDFSFTRISNSSHHGPSLWGHYNHSHGGHWGGYNHYSGWSRIGAGLAAFASGFSLSNWFGGLFSRPSVLSTQNYYSGLQSKYPSQASEVVYRPKIVVKKELVTDEKTGQQKIRTTTTKTWIVSQDGKTDPIEEEIDLTKDKKTNKLDKSDNLDKSQQADVVKKPTTSSGNDGNGSAEVVYRPKKDKETNKPKPRGNVDGATSLVTLPSQDEVTISDESLISQPSVVTPPVPSRDDRPATTKADLESPSGLDKLSSQKLKATIENYIHTVQKQVDNLEREMKDLYIDFRVDYSSLPVLSIPDDGKDYDQGEIVKDYKDNLELWLNDVKVDAAVIRATRSDISFNYLKIKYPDLDEGVIKRVLDDCGNNREKADAALAKIANKSSVNYNI